LRLLGDKNMTVTMTHYIKHDRFALLAGIERLWPIRGVESG